MSERFRRGERVEWNFRGHVVTGKVKRRLVERAEIDGQVYAATKDDPRYVVKSDKTGKEVARRPAVLRRIP